MAMRGSRGRVLWGLQRRKLGLPVVILSCSLFFFAGFFGPLLFSQDPSGGGAHRVRYMEAVDDGGVPIPMPHGESGESRLSPIPFQVLSWKPRALYFPKFATAEQCETIIRKAKTRLKPSTLALREGETEETTKGVRTSSGTFVSASEDLTGTLSYIEQKIARATMIPRGNGEAFNILRYEIGQKYASHYDAFNPAEYGPQKSQRVASFLLYLSDVEEGGETMFPFENGENMHSGYDYQDCIGLKVKPRQGDGLLFYSLFTNGTIDPSGGPKDNGHSVLNSVSKIVSQIKKPQHWRSGSPLNWFPRKKIDSYLKRKIRILQEKDGLILSLDETLGNANPHYTRIAREKIAAREAARKAVEARKAAMVEASWCRVLRAARIQSKKAEAELEKAEKYATEAFETARAKGVMMYDRPDSPRRPCKVESHSSIGGKSTHRVAASFETAFDVDKEVMAAIKRAFRQLANFPPSSNKDEFKDLLWKISQNPDNSETDPEISSESEFDTEFSSDDEVNAQVTEKKQKKSNCRQLPNDRDKRSAQSFTELVNAMLNRLERLQEDELASLATIVATCGLNAALLELEHSKDHEQGTRSRRRNSSATGFMAGSSNKKEPVTEVPSLDKFLVKHVSRLEREVQEARNSRCQRAPGTSEVINTESKSISTEPFPDLGSILVKHVSKLEKEIQEARKSNKNNLLVDNEKTAVLSGSILHEKENKVLRNSQGLNENMQKANMGLQETVSSNQDKENIDSNTLTVLSVATEGKHQAGKLTETNDRTPFDNENGLELEHMKRSSVKHISRLERAKQEVLNSFSSQEQISPDKILVKPMHRLEWEKMQTLEQGTEYPMKRDQQNRGADVTASESLDKVLVKHVSRLERERMVSRSEYGPITTVKRRDQQPEKMDSLDEIFVKHRSKLEKAMLVASQQPVYDIIKHRKQTEVAASNSLDMILVGHQPELEKAKLTAAQQSEDYTKHADSRKQARERELQEAWGGLSLGNSIRPHLSRLERDRAAWKRAEDEERIARKGSDEII